MNTVQATAQLNFFNHIPQHYEPNFVFRNIVSSVNCQKSIFVCEQLRSQTDKKINTIGSPQKSKIK